MYPNRLFGSVCGCIGVALFIALSPHWVPHKIRRCYLGSRAPALRRRAAPGLRTAAQRQRSLPVRGTSPACRVPRVILDHDFEGPRVAPEAQKLTLIPYWPNLSHHLGTPFTSKCTHTDCTHTTHPRMPRTASAQALRSPRPPRRSLAARRPHRRPSCPRRHQRSRCRPSRTCR